MASRNLTRDMSYGRPIGHILAFSLPLIFGNLFQQMYSMVDTIIVGHTWAWTPLRRWGPSAPCSS